MKRISENELVYIIENTIMSCDDVDFLANNISADEYSQKSFLNLLCLEFALGIEKAHEIYEYRQINLSQCLTWIFDDLARNMGINQRASSLFGAEDIRIVETLVSADAGFRDTLKRIGNLCEKKEFDDLVDILKAKYHSACADINSENFQVPKESHKVETIVNNIIKKSATVKIKQFLQETKELPSVLPLYERYLEKYGEISVFEMCELASDVKKRAEAIEHSKKGVSLENQVLAKTLLTHLQSQLLTRLISQGVPPGGASQKSEAIFMGYASVLSPIEIHCLLPVIHMYVKEDTAQKLYAKYGLLHYYDN